MGIEQDFLSVVDKPSSRERVNFLTNQLLTNENLPLLQRTSSSDTTTDQVLPKVSLYNSRNESVNNYNNYGDTSADKQNKDNKQDSTPKADKNSDQTQSGNTETWGGDAKEPKNRKKPMDVEIQPDGSATVTVKPGDTVWDIAKRMLQEQARRSNPPKPEPSNKEIFEKMKEIEALNGGNKRIIHPGEKIKIGEADVAATQKARGETHTTDDGKGNRTITHADGSSIKVEAGADGKPAKVTETGADGKAHTYTRGEDGKWKDENGKEVKIEADDRGTVSITDAEGNVRKHYKNGTVDSTPKSGPRTVTTPDGTVYTKTDPGWDKADRSGNKAQVKDIAVDADGKVTEKTEEKKEEEGKTETTKQGDTTYTIKRDKAGNVTEVTTDDGKGNKHVYKKEYNGEWLKDGRCMAPDSGFKVEEKAGAVTITDGDRQFTVNADNTVAVIKDGTTPNNQQDAPQQRKEYRTNNGVYIVKHVDAAGNPDDLMVDNNGTITHYRKNGDKWEMEVNGEWKPTQPDEISVSKDAGTGVITVNRTYNAGKPSAFKVKIELRPDGTGEETNA